MGGINGGKCRPENAPGAFKSDLVASARYWEAQRGYYGLLGLTEEMVYLDADGLYFDQRERWRKKYNRKLKAVRRELGLYAHYWKRATGLTEPVDKAAYLQAYKGLDYDALAGGIQERFYLIPPLWGKAKGLYIEEGEWAFSPFYTNLIKETGGGVEAAQLPEIDYDPTTTDLQLFFQSIGLMQNLEALQKALFDLFLYKVYAAEIEWEHYRIYGIDP